MPAQNHPSSEKIAPCPNFKKTAADSDIKSARCIQPHYFFGFQFGFWFLDDGFGHRMMDTEIKSDRYIRLFRLFFVSRVTQRQSPIRVKILPVYPDYILSRFGIILGACITSPVWHPTFNFNMIYLI